MTFPLFQGPQTPSLFVEQLKSGFTEQISPAQADDATTGVWKGTLTDIPATIANRSGADASGSQGMVVSFARRPLRYARRPVDARRHLPREPHRICSEPPITARD